MVGSWAAGRRACLAAFVGVLATLVPIAEASSPSLVSLAGGEDLPLVLNLEAAASTTGPFLSLDPQASAVDSFKGFPETAGATSASSAITGTLPVPLIFQLDKPLSRTYWLNLSKPIGGVLHWQSSVSVPSGRESGTLRVELYDGPTFAGGDSQSWAVGALSATTPLYFRFRPEVSVLEVGHTLSLKVYRIGGFADLTIVTGGLKQSYLELRTFEEDPFRTAVYLEDHQIRPAIEEGDSGGQAASWSPVWLLAGIGTATGRHRRLLLLAVLFAPFAGCLSSGPGTGSSSDTVIESTGSPTPDVDIESTSEPRLEGTRYGAIGGIVRDGEKAGIGLEGTHVALLGTSLFTTTDAKGLYEIANVTEGRFTLTFEAKDFDVVVQDVTVRGGQRLYVNVTLHRSLAPEDENAKAHRHDLWASAVEREFFQSTALPGSSIVDLSPVGLWTGMSLEPIGCRCSAKIPIPAGATVLPGTSRIEIVLTWDTSLPTAPTEYGLLARSPGSSWTETLLARAPGITFNVPIFPTDADSGHQTWTEWEFTVLASRATVATGLSQPYGRHLLVGGPVEAVARIHKGVVPFEPSHPRFWGNLMEMDLFIDDERGVPGGTVGYVPRLTAPFLPIEVGGPYPAYEYWKPSAGRLVPPGTSEVRGMFSWTNIAQTPKSSEWALAYLGADHHPASPNWKYATLTPTGPTSASFTIQVDANETDEFYSRTSRWRFSPEYVGDDAAKPVVQASPSFNEVFASKFTLSAKAFRDPSYDGP